MLHVLDGDGSTSLLVAGEVPGPRVVFREMLAVGPAPRGLATPEDWRERERVVQECLEPRYRAPDLRWIEAATKEDEIVLWFDEDLFCQANLAFLAARLPEGPQLTRASGTHQRRAPREVRSIFEGRVPLAREPLRRAWSAFGNDDPRALLDVVHEVPAFRDHLAQFPGAGDGLGETERRVLRAIAEGAPMHAAALHARVGEGGYGDALGLTDRDIERAVAELQRGPRALADANGLTRDGRDVLDGRADNVRLRGIDRWLGGVHLRGTGPVWRWDGRALAFA